ELHQLVLQVDDLIQPGAKQIAFPRCLRLLRSHPSPPLRRRNHDRRFEGIFKIKNASFRALKPQKLAISKPISSEKSTLAQCLGNCSRTTTDVASKPKEEQREIVARGEKEILEAAKAVRACVAVTGLASAVAARLADALTRAALRYVRALRNRDLQQRLSRSL